MPKSGKAKAGSGKKVKVPSTGTEAAGVGEGVRESAAVWARGGDVFISVHAKPGARQSRVTEVGERVEVQVAAPAQEGAANAELVRMMAEVVGVGRGTVSVVAGQRSREKRLRLAECALHCSEVLATLQASTEQSQ